MDAAAAGLIIGERIKPFTGCIIIFPINNYDPSIIITQGSCGLLNTGTKRFIVTANHVLKAIENSEYTGVLARGEDTMPIDVSDWGIIDRSTKLDIATIDVPNNFDVSSIGRYFFN